MKARSDVNWDGVGQAIIYKTVKFHRIQSEFSLTQISVIGSPERSLLALKTILKHR